MANAVNEGLIAVERQVAGGAGAVRVARPARNIRVSRSKISQPVRNGYAGKRTIDVVFALLFLIFTLPLLAVVWMSIRLESPGPGIFWSTRVGRNGRSFSMPKFRTMSIATPLAPREDLGVAATPYMTRIGDFLRKSSIDELPQIWSVLCGDMSFIGPRPLLAEDAASLARRDFPSSLRVTPGLSGLAQIRGRNFVTPRRKARYDAFYAERIGWKLDGLIFYATAIAVLTKRGVM